jgi:hypothetical protein
MYWKHTRLALKDRTFDDRAIRLASPELQPLTSGNQSLRVILLLASTSATVHNPHGERRHRPVEPGELGKKLAVFRDHRCARLVGSNLTICIVREVSSMTTWW